VAEESDEIVMSSVPRPSLTAEQYLEMERNADTKSEYYDGEMLAMAGGAASHSELQIRLALVIGKRLNLRSSRIFSSDLRVKVSATGLYTYPDLSVTCEQPRFTDERRDTLLNPALIAEVLSPSTEAYDRTDKFAHYRTIDSLTHYLLISQDRVLVELFTRAGSQWVLTVAAEPGDVVSLCAIGADFPVDELYDGIELSAGRVSRWPTTARARPSSD
jgi:Uma2 family endonuclease